MVTCTSRKLGFLPKSPAASDCWMAKTPLPASCAVPVQRKFPFSIMRGGSYSRAACVCPGMCRRQRLVKPT